MKRCQHRGHLVEDGKPCPYHGLSADFCFKKAPLVSTLDYDPSLLPRIVSDIDEMFHCVRQEVQAPWYLWIQNTADFHHLQAVHGGGFSNQFSGAPFDIRISADQKKSSHRLAVQRDKVNRFEGFVGHKTSGNFLHLLHYPSESVTSFLDVFYSMEYAVPLEEHKSCIVVTKFYTSKANRVPSQIIRVVAEANEKILAEDKKIMESWAPTATVSGLWLPYEARVKAYNEVLKREKVI